MVLEELAVGESGEKKVSEMPTVLRVEMEFRQLTKLLVVAVEAEAAVQRPALVAHVVFPAVVQAEEKQRAQETDVAEKCGLFMWTLK